MNIFIKEMDKDSATRITSVTDRDIAGYFWANDNRLVYLRDDGGNEDYYLLAVDRDGSNELALTKMEGVKTQIIDDLENIPDEMIIGLNKRIPQIFDPYRININSGEMEMVAENPGNIIGWMTDHDGKLRVAYTSDGVNQSLLYRETESDPFEVIMTNNFKETMEPLFFTFDNKNLYASSNIGRDKSALVVFDLATRQETDTIFQHDEVDVSGLSYSRKRKVLTTINYYTDKPQKEFLDDEAKAIYASVEKQLGNERLKFGLSSANDEEDKFIVRTYNDKTRGSYYYYDKVADELTLIDEISPWIDETQMAEMKPITYTARDGLKINGYLTLPVGYEAKNLPVVVNVHGGPWARDYWGFNPEVQLLANRGYAVLQMNFRGSTGYGREFWEKSFGQWGRTMQEDVQDGAKWLIEQGIADPERVAIYGGSYGGYATLMGLVKDPDFYACGIDYVGVSSIFTFMSSFPPYWEPFREMMYEMVGHPESDSLMLAEVSPALHADKITAPLFIAQGANDPRVKKAESDQMVEALKAKGIDVGYMVKENEGHGFRNEENKFDFYNAMEEFLAKHLAEKEKV
jgi:dipeptidyl aminopeptidase/acylaminoacyl peptidase